MEFSTDQALIALAGGFIAGCMNTLAGYGSIITLTILMDIIGLPPNIANGTNRVNVFTGVFASFIAFKKNGKLNFTRSKWIIGVTFIGALLGIWLAVNVSSEQFKSIFKLLIVVLFAALLVKPKRWLRDESELYDMPLWKIILIFFPIGLYGGFIQMGMGLVFVAATVLLGKYSILESNALKVVIVLLYTIVSLLIFQYNGMVEWKAGLLVGVGAALGGYLTGHYASKYKQANLWAYRLLITVVVLIIVRQFFF